MESKMPLDVKQYAEELFKAAGVSDDTVKQAVTNFLSNDVVAKRLEADVLRQSDYSRNMDKLAQDAKKSTDYYNSLLNWEAQRKKDWEEAMAGATHRETVQQVQPDLTAIEKKWEDKFTQQGNQMIGLLEVVGELASGHAVEFKERLDTQALKKIAMDKNL